MHFKEPDFVAELRYKTAEQGGRQTPAHSGYRPQVKFPFTEMQTSGQQKFIGKEIVYPGETVKAEIRILSVEFFQHQLSEGMLFEFREGANVIGTGIILSILNPKLQKAIA
jgi:translation elongation factor EF-Tu-like GTPase